MATVVEYLQTCKIKLSTTKTVSAAFHRNNKEAKRELKVYYNNEVLPFCPEPKHRGVTLDRSLTHCRQLDSLRKKLTSRVALLRRLAGSGWGAGATTLRTATLALVHSTAEYCGPVWWRIAHTRLIDPAINEVLRIVTGCLLRPFPADNLPILASIQPAELRRNGATLSLAHVVSWSLNIFSTQCLPAHRVQMHRALNRDTYCTRRRTTHQFICQQQHTCGAVAGSPMERGVIGQPHKTPHIHHRHRDPSPGATLAIRAWVVVNRLRTGVGRFRSCLYKLGMASSSVCECDAEEQTVNHVVVQCPIHRPPHGLHGLTVLNDETIEWLLHTGPEMKYGQAVVRTTGSKEEENPYTVRLKK